LTDTPRQRRRGSNAARNGATCDDASRKLARRTCHRTCRFCRAFVRPLEGQRFVIGATEAGYVVNEALDARRRLIEERPDNRDTLGEFRLWSQAGALIELLDAVLGPQVMRTLFLRLGKLG